MLRTAQLVAQPLFAPTFIKVLQQTDCRRHAVRARRTMINHQGGCAPAQDLVHSSIYRSLVQTACRNLCRICTAEVCCTIAGLCWTIAGLLLNSYCKRRQHHASDPVTTCAGVGVASTMSFGSTGKCKRNAPCLFQGPRIIGRHNWCSLSVRLMCNATFQVCADRNLSTAGYGVPVPNQEATQTAFIQEVKICDCEASRPTHILYPPKELSLVTAASLRHRLS